MRPPRSSIRAPGARTVPAFRRKRRRTPCLTRLRRPAPPAIVGTSRSSSISGMMPSRATRIPISRDGRAPDCGLKAQLRGALRQLSVGFGGLTRERADSRDGALVEHEPVHENPASIHELDVVVVLPIHPAREHPRAEQAREYVRELDLPAPRKDARRDT